MTSQEKTVKKGIKSLLLFIEKSGEKIELRKKYLVRPVKDFSRNRKLNFALTVSIILSLLKKVYPQV